MRRWTMLSLALLVLACAKKGMPPNPDRFPPSLLDFTVVNQNRLDLTFDEPMAQKDLPGGLAHLSDYSITGLGGDTLPVLGVAFSPDQTVISLLTRRQQREKYVLKGITRDVAGNTVRFARQFQGSTRPDTIAPAIISVSPRMHATNLHRDVAVTFIFSKPIDTLTFGGFLVLPSSLSGRFSPRWNPGLNGIQFMLADSLGRGTVVSFLVPPVFRDFAGNHPAQAGYTSFSSDSLVLPGLVKGRLEVEGGPARNAFILLEQDEPLLATIGREDGSFVLRAKKEPYAVVALADTDYDGYVELSGFRARAELPETLVVRLEAETSRVKVASFFGTAKAAKNAKEGEKR